MKKILLLLCAIVLFTCCNKYDPNCGQYKDEYYKLSNNNKTKISFKGFDTLVFISNVGDTAILYGQAMKTTNVGFPQQTTNADCPGITEYYEKIEIGFWGNQSELYNINFKYYVKESSGKDYLDFNINNQYNFTNRDLSFLNNPSAYNKDSVMYKNNLVYGYNPSSDPVNSSNILYNYNYGILRIKINGGKTWILN